MELYHNYESVHSFTSDDFDFTWLKGVLNIQQSLKCEQYWLSNGALVNVINRPFKLGYHGHLQVIS